MFLELSKHKHLSWTFQRMYLLLPLHAHMGGSLPTCFLIDLGEHSPGNMRSQICFPRPPLFQTETQSSISKHQGAPQCCTSISGRHCIPVFHCRIHWPDALSQHSWTRKVPVLVPALSSVCTEPTEQCKVKCPHFLSKIPSYGVAESKHSGSTQIPCFIFSIHLLRPSQIRGEAASHLCTEGGHWTPVASPMPNDPTTKAVRGGRDPPSPAVPAQWCSQHRGSVPLQLQGLLHPCAMQGSQHVSMELLW